MQIMNEKDYLTDRTIDKWSSQAEELYVQALKGKEKASQKVRLGVEEILLRIRDRFGPDVQCSIKCIKSRNSLDQVKGLRSKLLKNARETGALDMPGRLC